MSSSAKVPLYSVSDLKNTTDDALPNYLASLKFTQRHTHTDIRLLLGFSAVAIGAATFYFDWYYDWDVTKHLTLYAVVAYFVLNGAFTYWIWAVEKGLVWEGRAPNGSELMLFSRADKNTPIYHMNARYRAKGAQEWTEMELQGPFMRWFSSDGKMVPKPFQQFVASFVPVVGEADPENVIEEIGRGSEHGEKVTTQTVKLGDLGDVMGQIKAQASGAQGGKGKAKRRG